MIIEIQSKKANKPRRGDMIIDGEMIIEITNKRPINPEGVI